MRASPISHGAQCQLRMAGDEPMRSGMGWGGGGGGGHAN